MSATRRLAAHPVKPAKSKGARTNDLCTIDLLILIYPRVALCFLAMMVVKLAASCSSPATFYAVPLDGGRIALR